MIILLLSLFFFSDIQFAGFAGNTLLLTNYGQVPFEKVGYNTLIQSKKNHLQPVLFLNQQSVKKSVQITVGDEHIVCHKKQLFWCVNKNASVCAKDLLPGTLLQTVKGQYISVDAVEIIEKETEIYLLSVGPPHHLYVGKHAVLAHIMLHGLLGLE